MAVKKIELDGNVLIDLTQDTVTSGSMLSGTKAHDKDGEPIIGSYTQPTASVSVSSTSAANAVLASDTQPRTINGTTQSNPATIRYQSSKINMSGTVQYVVAIQSSSSFSIRYRTSQSGSSWTSLNASQSGTLWIATITTDIPIGYRLEIYTTSYTSTVTETAVTIKGNVSSIGSISTAG